MSASKIAADRFIGWDDEPETAEAWPTGNVFLDYLTGIGGLPKGRVVETFGPESSGKSTLGFQTAAYVWQKFGIPSHLADFEHAVDFRYLKSLGLTPEGLLLEQPETLEEYLESLANLLTKGPKIALSIVDSVASAISRDDLKAEVDARAGGMNRARIWTQNLSKMVGPLAEAETTLLLVNQTRVFIDTTPGFVPPGVAAMRPKVSTPGGKGIKFYASLRVEFEQSSDIKVERVNPLTLETEKVAVGKNVWLRVRKNKVAPPPWRAVRLQIRDGLGFDLAQNLLDFALVHGIIRKGTQGRYWFPGSILGGGSLPDGAGDLEITPQPGFTGEQVAVQTLRTYPEVAERLTVLLTQVLAAAEVEDQALPEDEA